MKTKLLFLIAMMSVLISYGQTNIGGTLTSDAQWTLEGSPYILTSTVGILNGNTLTIDAGVEVQGDFDLLVKGTILIEGTSSENIIFRNTRLIFKEANLTNSNIEYVEFTDSSGVQLADESENNEDSIKNSGSLTIEKTNFINGSYARAKGYFLVFEGLPLVSTLKLIDCDFEESIIEAQVRSNSIEIENCNINNSSINSGYDHDLKISSSNLNNTSIKGGTGAYIDLLDSTLVDCEIEELSGGVSLIVENCFMHNPLVNLGLAYFEINNSYFYIDQRNSLTEDYMFVLGNGKIEETVFKSVNQDLTAVRLTGFYGSYNVGSRPNSILNSTFDGFEVGIEVSDFDSIEIDGCNFLNVNSYSIMNKSSNNIDATENYWGTTDETIIANQIFDGLDDINYGIVNYSNYLTEPTENAPISEPKNVFKGSKDNGVLITWSANEETNLAGYKIYFKVNDSDEYTLLADVGNVTSYTTEAITTATIVAIKAYNTDADGDNDLVTGDESVFSLEAGNIFENVSLSSNTICSGEALQMDFDSNYSFSDVNEFTLQISDANGSFETATNIQTISTVEEGFSFTLPETLISGESYFLRITSSDLAVVSEASDIVTYDSPDTDFEITTSACSSDIVTVTYTGASEFYEGEFLWDFNGATIISGEGFGPYELQWQTEGEKTITLEVAENGCSSSNSEIITIKQTPVANFSIQDSVCGGETVIVEFTETISETAIYTWDFDEAIIISGNGAGPYEINWGDSYGEKNVSLSVADNGCTSELVEKLISHNEYPIGTIQLDNQICSGETTSITLSGDFTSTTNYTWNFNGGTIVSGNGSGPYEILWNTEGIKNVKVSIENNTCVTNLSEEIEVLDTPSANFSVDNVVCGDNIVEVSIEGDVSESATYTWDFDDAIIVSGEGAGPYEITWGISYGEKNITLSVSNNGCTSETNTEVVQYNALPTLSFEAEETVCYNEDFTIEYTGDNFTDVYWYFGEATIVSGSGEGPYILNWDESGEKTIFFQANNNGCFVSEQINVTVLPELTIPDLCIITVDEETSKNKLIWDYNAETLSQFGIYKETNISDVYELVSYVDDTVSEFIDIDSSPIQRSNRYKISALDTCGSETNLSTFQKTIHLTISKGTGDTWNLIWDNYEGVDFSSYKIFRELDGTGFELLTEISNNLNSFTDVDVTTDNVSYVIEIVSSESCGNEISNKNVLVKKENNLLSSRSNIASSNTSLSIEDLIYNELKVYPNPASDFIQVDLSYELLSYELLSMLGQSIKQGNLNEGNKIDVSDLSKGQYLLRISTEKGDVIKKFLKK